MGVKHILIVVLLIKSPIISSASNYYIATSDLHVRSGAGKEYSILLTLQKGEKVEVLSENRNWFKIKYSETTGYAHSNYLIPTPNTWETIEIYCYVLIIIFLFIAASVYERRRFNIRRKQRRDYYRNEYLQSDEWQRKRYVVLKRDNWCCVFCGAPATQVHHKRYAKKNIGNEPIKWLVSVCKPCHEAQHQ